MTKLRLEEVERPKVIIEIVPKYVLELTAEELAVLYGALSIVDQDNSEDGKVVKGLMELFEETHNQWYPGFYSLPEVKRYKSDDLNYFDGDVVVLHRD